MSPPISTELRPRIVVLATHPITVRNLMRGQLAYLRSRGFEVIAVASPGPELDEVRYREHVETIGLPMEREISPLKDCVALWRMVRLMRRLRPHLVSAGTAKAALLGLLAARLTGVPVRVYLLRGLRLETTGGWKRHLLAMAERITARAATRVICVSPSLQDAYIASGYAAPDKTVVLGSGSSNGVDAARFTGSRTQPATGQLRSTLKIPPDVPVVGFVGRFVRDKGIAELLTAFRLITRELPETRLLLLGAVEPGQPIGSPEITAILSDPQIVNPGFVSDPAPYYALMDVLALPSYREGFPNVPLEAAAAETPTVAFHATGTCDAIVDGVTGILVPNRDPVELARTLLQYLRNPALRLQHGRAARERVLREFAPQRIWEALYHEYLEQLSVFMPVVPRSSSIPAPSQHFGSPSEERAV